MLGAGELHVGHRLADDETQYSLAHRLDHARAKRFAKARWHGERDTDKELPHVVPALGWRTEYPKEFPVIVTRIQPDRAADAE